VVLPVPLDLLAEQPEVVLRFLLVVHRGSFAAGSVGLTSTRCQRRRRSASRGGQTSAANGGRDLEPRRRADLLPPPRQHDVGDACQLAHLALMTIARIAR